MRLLPREIVIETVNLQDKPRHARTDGGKQVM